MLTRSATKNIFSNNDAVIWKETVYFINRGNSRKIWTLSLQICLKKRESASKSGKLTKEMQRERKGGCAKLPFSKESHDWIYGRKTLKNRPDKGIRLSLNNNKLNVWSYL